MKIVPHDKKYKNTFIEMNKQWISKMFVIEEEDLTVLNNAELYICLKRMFTEDTRRVRRFYSHI